MSTQAPKIRRRRADSWSTDWEWRDKAKITDSNWVEVSEVGYCGSLLADVEEDEGVGVSEKVASIAKWSE